MRSRDQWKKAAQKNKDPHAWSVYKNLRREVKHEIRTAEKIFIAKQVVNNKKTLVASGKQSACAYPRSPPLKGIIPKMTKLLLMSSIIFFSRVGKSIIDRITKLAEESNYTLNQCSFIPRIYPLSEQFTFNAVK